MMRRTLVLITLLLSGCASAPWSEGDVAREVAYVALSMVDLGQTLDCGSQPATCHEANPAVGGEHPSRERTVTFMVATRALHVLLVHVLPPDWREPFQWGSIFVEGAVVLHNRSLGLSVNF